MAASVDTNTATLLGLNPNRQAPPLGQRAGSRIRLVQSGATASTSRPSEERRRTERVAPDQTRWADAARLRPGIDVRVVDIGTKGVLVESPVRLHIGMRAELSLFVNDTQVRVDMAGAVCRCHVASLDPLVYRGALEFDSEIELQSLEAFMSAEVKSA